MSDRPDSRSLLDQASAKREQAQRCRAFAEDMTDRNAAALLTDYAIELDERADVLERLAFDSRGRARVPYRRPR